MRACKKCEWWELNSGAADPNESDIGHCHKKAPHCKITEDQCSPCAVWPVTEECDWCGKFKEKVNE